MFPDASVHCVVIVYNLPSPFPNRSAFRFSVRSPVITASPAATALAPGGSLVLTEMILQETAPQLSVDAIATLTGTILWFGGHKLFGLAVTELMTGGVLSTTVTVAAHWLDTPRLFVTVRVTGVLPNE